jgi:hypothetical protein
MYAIIRFDRRTKEMNSLFKIAAVTIYRSKRTWEAYDKACNTEDAPMRATIRAPRSAPTRAQSSKMDTAARNVLKLLGGAQ